jgi:hypothetical protein
VRRRGDGIGARMSFVERTSVAFAAKLKDTER